ncbi:hypothetical protein IEU95_07370 [Hoyosella rhizosphaerae]|uniref:hypothetical protein n=1 Tax=Hoyosella rhizosphaerae TaxID=1755582 RepID=UPI00166E0278|nr:hypothetical protein [Hoyosella rhizosphaerae]MBN4926643.1 hypothetical protein [Hoyosella rhizosphaerae]
MTKHDPSLESVPPIGEAQIDQFWNTVDLNDPHVAIAQMKSLITEFGLDDAIAHFEMASVYDAIGFESEAATEYEAAPPSASRALVCRRHTFNMARRFATSDEPAKR